VIGTIYDALTQWPDDFTPPPPLRWDPDQGWLYPNGLQDYMAALSAFLVDPQPVTPVMNAAGLSAACWFRQMLVRKGNG
jgi:hypothetical protein